LGEGLGEAAARRRGPGSDRCIGSPARAGVRLAATLGLAAHLLVALPATAGSLATEDRARLSEALETLSVAWDSDAVHAANMVFLDTRYGSDEFVDYFTGFFATHPLSAPLLEYLTYPTLSWFGDDVHRKLQESLAPTLVARIDALFRLHPPDRLGQALESDPTLRDTLWYALSLLARIGHLGNQLSETSRAAVYTVLRELVADRPGVLGGTHAIDPEREPWVALLRAQLHKGMRDLEAVDASRLVADLAWEGPYVDLLLSHGVLLFDNRGLDARQIEVLDELLDRIPEELFGLAYISVFDTLGTPAQIEVYRFPTLGASPGVNVSAIAVDAALQNQFPSDVAPYSVPVFCSILQHELNHDVDRVAIESDPELQHRKLELIGQAGDLDSSNYLRSMFPPDTFVRAPQELFASIANQYFADSVHTLRLGLQRLEQGWREPIHQFLFFAEVYSLGGETTRFYELDVEGNYTSTSVPIGRDAWGHIDRLWWEGLEYRFLLDPAGNVIEFGHTPPLVVEIPVGSGGDDLREFESGKVDSRGDLHLSGSFLNAVRFEDVPVPRGASVQHAYLKLLPRRVGTGSIRIAYRAHSADDAQPIVPMRGALSALPKTALGVTDSPSGWRPGAYAASADIAPLIQEIVDRSGWSSGNALTVLVESDDTSRQRWLVTSYDSNPAAAPTLVLEYLP
jgi:hypothetical protein